MRLRAKTLIGYATLIPAITTNVPSTVEAPTSTGIRAPRRPKNSRQSSTSTGRAMSSARARSSPTWEPICSLATTGPPTATSESAPKASRTSSVTSTWSAIAVSVPATRTLSPSADTSPACGAERGDAVAPIPSMSASRVSISAIRGSSARSVSTSRITPAPPASPVESAIRSSASTEEESSSSNPSLVSEPATPPPRKPARTRKNRTPSRVIRGAAAMRWVSVDVMAPPWPRGPGSGVRPRV